MTAKFSVYEKQLQAKFSFALINRTVSAADEISGDLLSDRPVRALAPPPPEPVYASDQPEDAPGPVRLAAVPDANEAAEGEPAVARPASRRQKAHTRPVPVAVDDELFDQEALDDGWPEPRLPLDLAEHEPAADAPASQPATRAAVDQKPEVGQGVAEEPQLKRKSGEKPRMPSWDDILLGVRRKSE